MRLINIGRSSTNNIVINDVTVSSRHATITISDAKEIRIKDLNSTNGTYVNGKRITGETIITASDVIKTGNSTVDWVKYLNKEKKPALSFNNEDTSIKQKKIIGRTAENDIILNHKDVSSKHAQLIEKTNGEIVIADNGSTNGTFVNGKKISVQVLLPGDRLLIANKYPVDWQTLFSKSDNSVERKTITSKTIFISVATVVVIIGVFLFLHKEKTWSAEKIYTTYKKSVVMIEFAYYYQINIDGKFEGYYTGYKKDSQNNLHAGISKDFNPKLFDGSGTGFIVSNDGKIITNRHIVSPWNYPNKNEKNEIDFVKEYFENKLLNNSLNYDLSLLSKVGKITIEGKMYNEYLGVYVNGTHKSQSSKIPCSTLRESGSDDIDIGLIQINSKTLPTGVKTIVDLDKAVIEDEYIKEGIPVYLIGFPFGEGLATTTGGIQADHQDGKISQTGDIYSFRHNAASFGGASGSPIFNQYGKLIGVHHAGLAQSGAHGYGYAIKAKYAVELTK